MLVAFIVVIAVTNLVLGYALAIYLGRQGVGSAARGVASTGKVGRRRAATRGDVDDVDDDFPVSSSTEDQAATGDIWPDDANDAAAPTIPVATAPSQEPKPFREAPTPVAPTPVAPTPVAQTPVAQTPVAESSPAAAAGPPAISVESNAKDAVTMPQSAAEKPAIKEKPAAPVEESDGTAPEPDSADVPSSSPQPVAAVLPAEVAPTSPGVPVQTAKKAYPAGSAEATLVQDAFSKSALADELPVKMAALVSQMESNLEALDQEAGSEQTGRAEESAESQPSASRPHPSPDPAEQGTEIGDDMLAGIEAFRAQLTQMKEQAAPE